MILQRRDDQESENRMIAAAYANVRNNAAPKMFYGDVTEAGKILVPLRKILFGACAPTEQQYADAADLYNAVWNSIHAPIDMVFCTEKFIRGELPKHFKQYNTENAVQAIDLCLAFILRHEPSLEQKRYGEEAQPQLSKEMIMKQIMEKEAQKSPSEHFASGAVFDIARQLRAEYLAALQTQNALKLHRIFEASYLMFLDHPEVVGMTAKLVNKQNDDTQPAQWNVARLKLNDGDYAALLFMPVRDTQVLARIVGIIFSDRGDGYYYCMLKKKADPDSDVMRNKAMQGIEKVGQVRGLGPELMQSFLMCMKQDFYKNAGSVQDQRSSPDLRQPVQSKSEPQQAQQPATQQRQPVQPNQMPQPEPAGQTTALQQNSSSGKAELASGQVIAGKYLVLEPFGTDEGGTVYFIRNTETNKMLAMKAFVNDGSAAFQATRRKLIAETNIQKKLHHPGVPAIYDVLDAADALLIITDFLQGNTLQHKLKEQGAQPEKDVIQWGIQLCDILGYLHAQTPPVIYRNVKPSKIMLKPDGALCLVNFSTAREYQENACRDENCLGTQGYAAPEQYGGHGQTDARTDIYGIGAALYHLVTGQNPSQPPYKMYPIRQWNPELSETLESIILKCTAEKREDRFQNCEELKTALQNLQTDQNAQSDGSAQTEGLAQTDSSAQTEGLAQTNGSAQTEGLAQTDGSAQTEVHYCPYCGTGYRGNIRFCGKCGADLSAN